MRMWLLQYRSKTRQKQRLNDEHCCKNLPIEDGSLAANQNGSSQLFNWQADYEGLRANNEEQHPPIQWRGNLWRFASSRIDQISLSLYLQQMGNL